MHAKILLKKIGLPHLKRLMFLSSVIGIILLLMLISFYHIFQFIELQAVAQKNQDFSFQVDRQSDSLQETLSSFAMQIFYSPAAATLRENSFLDHNRCVFAIRELSAYVSSCAFVDLIAVYNGKKKYIYTTSSKYSHGPADQFYDMETAQLFLQRNKENRLCPIWSSLAGDENTSIKGCYSFLYYELDKNGGPGDSAIMIDIPYDWFVSQLLGNQPGDSYVILDSNGGLVAARSEQVAVKAASFWNQMDENSKLGNKSGYLIGNEPGNNQTVCLYAQMQSSDWYCIRVLGYRDCLPELAFLHDRILPALALLLTFILGGFLILLMNIYFPFRQMNSALKSLQKKTDSSGDESKIPLPDQMDLLIKNSLNLRLERELTLLLNGQSLSFSQPTHAPLALILAEGGTAAVLRKYVFSKQPDAVMTAINGLNAIFFGGFRDTGTPASLCGEIASRFGCRCYFSTLFELPSQAYHHFKRLTELRNLHILYVGQSVFDEKMLNSRSEVSGFAEKDLARLGNALRSGNMQETEKIYYAIFESIRNDRYVDFCFALGKLQQAAFDGLREIGQEYRQISLEQILTQAGSCKELHGYFLEMFRKITEWQLNQKQQKMHLIAQRVQQQIESGFRDPLLSPQSIAESMKMSPTYLGHIFRGAFGIAIAGAINEVRIEHAKEMLVTTNQTATAIAGALGYENVKYFFVLFKRATGLTPLQYRAAHTVRTGQPDNQ
jgi:AraC-like DNA-binding protein